MIGKSRLLGVMMIMLVTIGVWAQPPGGGRGGDSVPNVEVPKIDEIILEVKDGIDIDTASQELLDTVSDMDIEALENMDFDADMFSEMMENFEVPENWADMDFTGEMPSKDELMEMADELPIDIDSLDIQLESSPQATNAIIGFASSMLSLNVTPLYAGEYSNGDLDGNAAAQETMSQVYSQLDGDMQALLTQASELSGVAYWALLEDGVALLYTGDCDLDQCTIEQEMVQVEITNGSAGAYAILSDAVTSSTAEAKSLVQSTFPYLATIELSETESSAGTGFFAFDIDMDSQEVVAYYAGVYDAGTGQSVVYAVSGIGDAYINMLLGG
jgi:hypothetical protein